MRLVQKLRHESTDVLDTQRTKARHPIRGIEIPSVLRQADEIADGGISCPSPAKRRACQLQRHIRRKESLDIRSGLDRIDWRQGVYRRGLAGSRRNGFGELGRVRRRILLVIR